MSVRSVRPAVMATFVGAAALLGLVAATAATGGSTLPAAPRTLAPADAPDIAAACGTTNPFLAAAVLGRESPGVDPATLPAVVAFRHGGAAGGAPPIALATRADVGDVYGLAYDHTRQAVYVSAYHRAGGAFGPGGPGGVYRIDVATGAVAVLARLDAGPDVHASGDPSTDRNQVGKTSLGDIDIAEDGSELYVANLSNGWIYRVALPDGRVRDGFPNGDLGERWGDDDARVFALAVRGRHLYHGTVNSREVATAPGVFEARVFRSTPGSRDAYRILRIGLEYVRSFGGVPWSPWSDDSVGARVDSAMLVDLAFRPDGAPILGLRDRVADMDPACVWAADCPAGPSVGDILPARLAPDESYWEVLRQPPWYQDTGPDNIEATFGALAALPGMDVVASMGRSLDDPAPAVRNRLFAHWFANGSGALLRSEPVLRAVDGPGGTSSTVIGLAPGDVEAMCAPQAEIDPALVGTATAEAGVAATERARREAVSRATAHAATQTAGAPIRIDRQAAAAATGTYIAPTLDAEAPTMAAAATIAAGTAAVVVPARLTALAPTAVALATRRARVSTPAPATATAAALVYDTVKGSCGTGNPYMITTRFVPRLDGQGRAYSPVWQMAQPAVVAFNNTDPEDAGAHFTLAAEPAVGAAFGVGYDLTRDQIYVGAYTKRLAEYGPLGPGAIYQIDLRTSVTRPWALLDAGIDPHDMKDEFDVPAASAVGHTGLGDVEVAEAGDQLFAVNLADRLIYRLAVPEGHLLGAFPHGAAGQWWAADAAPFGLAFRDGWLYHGVVDTGTTDFERGLPAVARRPQMVYVFRSRPDGTDMREVARIDLDYGRGPAWQPWALRLPNDTHRAEPMLTDIEFRLDGDLVLGLRDRGGDARILRAGYGDIVLTMGVGDRTRFIPLTVPEVYQDDIRHPESSWGTLASLPWLDETVSTVVDPVRIWSGGAGWFDNASGRPTRFEEVYAGANQTFGKSAGLGDIEALCAALTPTPSSTPTDTPTPTATDTGTAAPSGTPTPIPTVTRTPTPGRYTVYLPEGHRDAKCIPDAFYADVVLVLDRSTSMLRPVETGGMPKNEAAIDAAKRFVDVLDLTPDALGRHDQVAVVGFNDTAWTQLDLSYDRAAVMRALDEITHMTAEGTRLDLALIEGQKPLDGPRHIPANQPVIILLTDGLPNRVPTPVPAGPQEETVGRAAAAAKAKGTRIYTVGLGKPTDINPRLLIYAASERWMYYYAPRPEALAAIYDQIAHTFDTCDPYEYVVPTPCVPEDSLIDAVLVLDMSTSMYRTTGSGRTKHEAAIQAAKVFLDQMDFEPDGWGQHDQVAVVGFNDTAWTALDLSRDRAAIDRALDGLMHRIQEGTRLDLAFQEGQRAAENPAHLPENQPVIVFLTDGLPNRVPTPVPVGPQEETVLRYAVAAKAKGTRVFTIGLGESDDVLKRLLELCATEPSMFYFAPDGEDLEAIYRAIAGRVNVCP